MVAGSRVRGPMAHDEVVPTLSEQSAGTDSVKHHLSKFGEISPSVASSHIRSDKSVRTYATEQDIRANFNHAAAPIIDVEGAFNKGFSEFVRSLRHFRVSDVVPAVGWFPRFLANNPLNSMFKDAVCGLTVAAIVVPQGMAYGMLAGLPPVNGLYTAMLPVLGYTLFGTCMHLSVGPFALISMLTAEGIFLVVDEPVKEPEAAVDAAKVLSLLSGVTLLLMGILRLGFIGTFLSDPVLSGYCTAVAIIIPMSQMKYAFQVYFPRGNFISTVENLLKNIDDVNYWSFGIFLVSLVTIYLTQMVNQRKPFNFLKKFPIPAELLVLVLSTLTIWVFKLDKYQNVQTLGLIPEGLPDFSFPDLGRFDISKMLTASFMVSLMTYITATSVSKTFARKFRYEIDSNKELIAFGIANLLGCVSSCYPAAASLSRTAVVGSSGAATPLHNIWMVGILVIVLMFSGELIQTLPSAALAAIVVMAFKSLLINGFAEARMMRRVSPSDFLMWSIAFWGTLTTNVTVGIAVAVAADIFFLFYKTTRPSYNVLGRLSGTENVYRPRKQCAAAEMVPGVLIFKFNAPLIFANKEVFIKELERELRRLDAEMNDVAEDTTKILNFWCNLQTLAGAFVDGVVRRGRENMSGDKIVVYTTSVIIECSPMTHVDITAARALEKLRTQLKERGTRLILCHVKYDCYCKFDLMGLFAATDDSSFDVVCFRELHDAVLFGEGRLNCGDGEASDQPHSLSQVGLVVDNSQESQAHSTTGTRISSPALGLMKSASCLKRAVTFRSGSDSSPSQSRQPSKQSTASLLGERGFAVGYEPEVEDMHWTRSPKGASPTEPPLHAHGMHPMPTLQESLASHAMGMVADNPREGGGAGVDGRACAAAAALAAIEEGKAADAEGGRGGKCHLQSL